MKLKRISVFLFTLAAIILEALPFSAVLNFANPYGEPHRALFSYFDPINIGYANFGPFLTAALTTALAVLTLICCFIGRRGIIVAVTVVSASAVATSLMPLMFGPRYMTATGFVITGCLVGAFIFSLFSLKSSRISYNK